MDVTMCSLIEENSLKAKYIESSLLYIMTAKVNLLQYHFD